MAKMNPASDRHVALGHVPAGIYTRPAVPRSPPPPLPTFQSVKALEIPDSNPRPSRFSPHPSDPTTGPSAHISDPAMAELVALDRSGGWHKRLREAEEVAVGVMGPLPRRQGPANALAFWLEGNRNGLEPTIKSQYDTDQETITDLLKSGMVDHNELLIYHTPDALLNQGEKIDPVNVLITDVINDMARSRRSLLRMKLKKKINVAESKKISNDLSKGPVLVQELQGDVSQLKGRYVRIPPVLVTKVTVL